MQKEGFYRTVVTYFYTGAYVVYFRKSPKKNTKFLYRDKHLG